VTYTNSVPCKVQTGILAGPYTGTSINFVRGATIMPAVTLYQPPEPPHRCAKQECCGGASNRGAMLLPGR
jgi:hypothetical protein